MLTDSLKKRMGPIVKRQVLLRSQRLPLQARARLGGRDDPPSRPIFVIGCPRSGTSILFNLLRRHEQLGSLPGEGHLLWSTYQHPSLKGWSSDRATGADVRPREPRYLYTAIHNIAAGRRFVDKTPRNTLKVPYLARLFPDAVYVFLVRDGRSTVSSIIEGWMVRHGISYRLPQRLQLQEYGGRLWSYLLVPEWRELASTTVARVAAAQYASAYETALSDLRRVPGDSVVWIRYEDLVADPITAAQGLLDRLELPHSDRVLEMAGNLGAYRYVANSPPRPEKWRDRSEQIAEIMPRIEGTMRRLGYDDVSG